MYSRIVFRPLSVLLCAWLVPSSPARSAESYDSCTGYVDSLPAHISTQGTWCLRKNLSTGTSYGDGIGISANNVTIDCNGFKIGGLAAGESSLVGIRAHNSSNVTIRNCSIRGFHTGIQINGNGDGHLIENNRLDHSRLIGIYLFGLDPVGIYGVSGNSRVQGNAVYDTGGASSFSIGISAAADVLDNVVAGMYADSSVDAIVVEGAGNVARGNRVRDLVVLENGQARGIVSGHQGIRIEGNHVSARVMTPGSGIYGSFATFCQNNTVANFETAYANCSVTSNNLELPLQGP